MNAQPLSREQAINAALAYMRASKDPTLSGVTIMLPSGETHYLDASLVRPAAEPQR